MSLFNLLSFDDPEIELIISSVREHCLNSKMEIESEFGRITTDRAIGLFSVGYKTTEALVGQLSRPAEFSPSD
jgi:hypothetical protein